MDRIVRTCPTCPQEATTQSTHLHRRKRHKPSPAGRRLPVIPCRYEAQWDVTHTVGRCADRPPDTSGRLMRMWRCWHRVFTFANCAPRSNPKGRESPVEIRRASLLITLIAINFLEGSRGQRSTGVKGQLLLCQPSVVVASTVCTRRCRNSHPSVGPVGIEPMTQGL